MIEEHGALIAVAVSRTALPQTLSAPASRTKLQAGPVLSLAEVMQEHPSLVTFSRARRCHPRRRLHARRARGHSMGAILAKAVVKHLLEPTR
jgi:hypothetical protein